MFFDEGPIHFCYFFYLSHIFANHFQIFFYHNVKCRGEMYDRDIVMLQVTHQSEPFLKMELSNASYPPSVGKFHNSFLQVCQCSASLDKIHGHVINRSSCLFYSFNELHLYRSDFKLQFGNQASLTSV